jgi:hypothetical protein
VTAREETGRLFGHCGSSQWLRKFGGGGRRIRGAEMRKFVAVVFPFPAGETGPVSASVDPLLATATRAFSPGVVAVFRDFGPARFFQVLAERGLGNAAATGLSTSAWVRSRVD